MLSKLATSHEQSTAGLGSDPEKGPFLVLCPAITGLLWIVPGAPSHHPSSKISPGVMVMLMNYYPISFWPSLPQPWQLKPIPRIDGNQMPPHSFHPPLFSSLNSIHTPLSSLSYRTKVFIDLLNMFSLSACYVRPFAVCWVYGLLFVKPFFFLLFS